MTIFGRQQFRSRYTNIEIYLGDKIKIGTLLIYKRVWFPVKNRSKAHTL